MTERCKSTQRAVLSPYQWPMIFPDDGYVDLEKTMLLLPVESLAPLLEQKKKKGMYL
jgi:hypothetical protein